MILLRHGKAAFSVAFPLAARKGEKLAVGAKFAT
jgi:hypothetical protein